MNDTPLSRAEERLVHALRTRKHRDAHGLFLAEGVRIAEEAVHAGVVLRLVLASPSLGDTPRGVALRDRLASRVTIRQVSDAALTALAPADSPQGVLLVAEQPRRDLAGVDLAEDATVLVLDGIQDPGNFGTLVRTADAFGAAAVLALPGTVDPWNAKAVRAAAGSSFHVPVVQAALADAVAWLRAGGFTVLGAAADGSPLAEVEQGRRSALIVGNEGAGLRVETAALADRIVSVPIGGRAESLNVGVAAGILLYQLMRARPR